MSSIPYAYSKNLKRLVDVTEVPRGYSCNCICPQCGMDMLAKQGEINEHHFSHYKNAEVECFYSYWASVRDMAKQIIQKARFITIMQYPSSNLHSAPYSLSSSLIEIFSLQNSSSFNFIAHSSLGALPIFIATPIHNKEFRDPTYAQLVLKIDIQETDNKGNYSIRERLTEIIINEPKNKQLFVPKFKKAYIEDDWINMDNEESEQKRVQIKQPSDAANIINQLHLDKRNIISGMYSTINEMKNFYYISISACAQYQSTYKFSILINEGNLKFISYKNHIFALATLNIYHVVYKYYGDEFIKISNTVNYDNIFEIMEQYIKTDEQNRKEAELVF